MYAPSRKGIKGNALKGAKWDGNPPPPGRWIFPDGSVRVPSGPPRVASVKHAKARHAELVVVPHGDIPIEQLHMHEKYRGMKAAAEARGMRFYQTLRPGIALPPYPQGLYHTYYEQYAHPPEVAARAQAMFEKKGNRKVTVPKHIAVGRVAHAKVKNVVNPAWFTSMGLEPPAKKTYPHRPYQPKVGHKGSPELREHQAARLRQLRQDPTIRERMAEGRREAALRRKELLTNALKQRRLQIKAQWEAEHVPQGKNGRFSKEQSKARARFISLAIGPKSVLRANIKEDVKATVKRAMKRR